MPRETQPRKSTTKRGKTKPPAAPSAINRLQFAQRVYTMHGYTRARDKIMERFGVSDTTAELDLAKVRARMAADAEEERPHLRQRLTQHLTRVASDAHRDGKFSAAVQADRAIGKLNGLEVDVISVGGMTPQQQAAVSALVLTPHQRRERELELRAKDRDSNARAASAGDDADD